MENLLKLCFKVPVNNVLVILSWLFLGINLYYGELTHISLASLLWDIGKRYSPRCDAAERGVPSGAILFASRIFIEKLNEI